MFKVRKEDLTVCVCVLGGKLPSHMGVRSAGRKSQEGGEQQESGVPRGKVSASRGGKNLCVGKGDS